jgi:ADP-heptose:LPS heptosyltransferase
LHAFLPEAKLSILVRKGNEGIYEGHPFLKEVLVWDKKEKKLGNLFRMLNRIRGNRYDCVVNCHRFSSSGFLTAFSGARHKAGYKQNPFSFLFDYTAKHKIGDGTHEVERYNQLVEDFTDKMIFNPKLYPSLNDTVTVRQHKTANYICMAPASVWFTKQLPLDKWVEICDNTDLSTTIYLLGAPNDLELCQQIKSRTSHDDIHIFAGKLTLLQSCALMKNAKMNYVNDSAPLHLASAVNAPVTAFFCSTVPEFGFGPLSDVKKIMQVHNLKCKPCGIHGFKACPLGHFKCGNEMDVRGAVD